MSTFLHLLKILVIMRDWIVIEFNYWVGDGAIPMRIEEMEHVGARMRFTVMQGLKEWGRFFKRNQNDWVWEGSGFTMEEIAGIVDRLGDVYDLDPDKDFGPPRPFYPLYT